MHLRVITSNETGLPSISLLPLGSPFVPLLPLLQHSTPSLPTFAYSLEQRMEDPASSRFAPPPLLPLPSFDLPSYNRHMPPPQLPSTYSYTDSNAIAHQQLQQPQFQQQQLGGRISTAAAAPAPPLSFSSLPPGLNVDMVKKMTKENFASVTRRYNTLLSQGHTESNSTDLAQLKTVIRLFGQFQEWAKEAHQREVQKLGGSQSQGQMGSLDQGPSYNPNPTYSTPSTRPNNSSSSRPPTSSAYFAPEQATDVRAQIQAWNFFNPRLPLPPHLQAASDLLGQDQHQPTPPTTSTMNNFEGLLQVRLAEASTELRRRRQAGEGEQSSSLLPAAEIGVNGWNGDASRSESAAAARGEGRPSMTMMEAMEGQDSNLPYAMELDKKSELYPYNSYAHPLSHLLKRTSPSSLLFTTSKRQRLLTPSLLPTGMALYPLLQQQNQFVETRIQSRIDELENVEEGSSSSNANSGIQSLIELKSLKLVEKQKKLREDLTRSVNSSSSIPTDRTQFRRYQTLTIRDARHTEALERRQRDERESRAKQKQTDYLKAIVRHGKDLVKTGSSESDARRKLGRSVLSYHSTTSREELKRVERLAKERLRALKNDDEESYLKLLDEAKDKRISHLLRQTSNYLDSLAQAVVAQQEDAGDLHRVTSFETEGGDADETMFGGKRKEPEPGEVMQTQNKKSYYAVSHRISEKVTQQPSLLVGGKLKDYQLKGLQWMVSLYNNRLNGILADEMGLGKTIQTLSLITFLIEHKKIPGPYLIIVPLSTITNWTLEFEKWAPSVSTVVFKGTPQARRDASVRIINRDFQVVITTFEYIIREKALLGKIKWVHMIIDEGHRLKNAESKLSQTLSLYYTARYRLILTGTPLQNNLPELWALLNFVLPKVFSSSQSFDDWFNAPFSNSGASDKMVATEEEQLLIIRRLHKVLRPFLLRRLKKDVESELPDKVEKVIKCKMSALQQRIYNTYRKHGVLQSEGLDKTGKSNIVKGLNNTVMQLRKICNHPFVIEAIEAQVNPSNVCDDSLWRSAGKFELLDRILPKLFATDHRVLLFFQMVKIMHIFEDYLVYRGYGDCLLRLDGSTKADDRTDLITKFNAPDSPYKIFILSTRAGGLGLNLQSADTVIIYDSDWNPHADLQAQDRAHRIGQKKVVKIFRLVTNRSIEEDILATAQGKLAIDGKVIQAGKFDDKSSAAEQEAFLRSLLEAEQEEGDEDDNGEMGDDEINELLARGDHEFPIFQAMDAQREEEATTSWKARGGTGPPPERLMTDAEVPEVYRRDVVTASSEKDEDEGRGWRVKAPVVYSEGLNDELFFKQLEGDSDDLFTPRTTGLSKITELDEKESAQGKKKTGRPSVSATLAASSSQDDVGRDSKRRKGPTEKQRLITALMSVYDGIVALRNEATNEPHSTIFLTTVNKKTYPTYHLVVQKPIWLNKIRKDTKEGRYKSVQPFWDDFQLLFSNAYAYNEEGSWPFVAAQALQDHLPSLWSTHIVGSDLPGAPPPAPSVSNDLNNTGTGTPTTAANKVEPRRIVLRGTGSSGGGGGGAAVAGPSRLPSQENYQPSGEEDEERPGSLRDGKSY
ncbi:SNF2 family N-terminal domain-containing protein [Mrakia frigida]|uniref:SNF2 family N-terminal domain-containing protein n=1 Tax=Mrakia frigida TaxID=29902 RepID=UPI003FCC02C5